VGVVVIVLVLAEGGARALGPYLPEPQLYGDDATQVKVAQMDGLGASCVDVVLAGDSMGRDAFDPAAFSDADGAHRRAYNASLDAASPAVLRRWLLEEVLPRLHPTTVVVTIASLDLNAHGNATVSARAAYETAALTRPGPGGRVAAWLTTTSDLVRYRTELRDPATLGDAIEDWRAGQPAARRPTTGIDGLLGGGGQGLSRRALRYRADVGTTSFTRSQLLGSYEIDADQVDAAHDLIRELRGQGVQVAIVVLPVTADYVALHPRGEADFDAFLAVARDLATDAGTPLVDLHAPDASAPAEMFADTHHLNEQGARWFSSTLPRRLADAGITTGPRCG